MWCISMQKVLLFSVGYQNFFGKRVISTIHGLDWAREKWKFGVGSKFIRQGEKNAVKYADEIIVLSKGVQKYFMETYGKGDTFYP